MAVLQFTRRRLRIGDRVEWTPYEGEELPSAGTILAVRESQTPEEQSIYVVQLTPTIIGVYQRTELNRVQ
jgi:hypothetical protein